MERPSGKSEAVADCRRHRQDSGFPFAHLGPSPWHAWRAEPGFCGAVTPRHVLQLRISVLFPIGNEKMKFDLLGARNLSCPPTSPRRAEAVRERWPSAFLLCRCVMGRGGRKRGDLAGCPRGGAGQRRAWGISAGPAAPPLRTLAQDILKLKCLKTTTRTKKIISQQQTSVSSQILRLRL